MITRGVVGLALIVSLLVLLSGCATNSMTRAEREQAYNNYIETEKLESLDRITAFRFDGWSDLGRKHLIINTTGNRFFLIALRNECIDLDFSVGINIHNTGSLLRARFDSISVPGNMQPKCFIDKIYKITPEQRKTLVSLHKQDNETSEAETTGENKAPKTTE